MKKNFKTIMALTAALAVSVSGMSMASAGQQVVDGDPATGKFGDVTPIPIKLTTTHLLSATIDYGDFVLNYSLKDGKFSDTSFNGTNNKLTVENHSTCPINATVNFSLDGLYNDVLSECGFQLTSDAAGQSTIAGATKLTYAGNTAEGAVKSCDVYLTAKKTENLEAIHGYNLNNAAIGSITVTLEPALTEVNAN